MKLAIAQMAVGLLILVVVLTCPAYLVIVAVPGLAVLGCGIAQYLKAREVRIKHAATPAQEQRGY